MLYHQKQNYVNIISGILITAVFALIVYRRQMEGAIDITQDFSSWGKLLLIFIGVSIVARIIIQIIFHIFNAIITREEDVPKKDERDRIIELKAKRNAYYSLSTILFAMVVLLAVGLPVFVVFIAFFLGGLATEIVENTSQIYYYKKNG